MAGLLRRGDGSIDAPMLRLAVSGTRNYLSGASRRGTMAGFPRLSEHIRALMWGVGRPGLEPGTTSLKVRCSTIELPTHPYIVPRKGAKVNRLGVKKAPLDTNVSGGPGGCPASRSGVAEATAITTDIAIVVDAVALDAPSGVVAAVALVLATALVRHCGTAVKRPGIGEGAATII